MLNSIKKWVSIALVWVMLGLFGYCGKSAEEQEAEDLDNLLLLWLLLPEPLAINGSYTGTATVYNTNDGTQTITFTDFSLNAYKGSQGTISFTTNNTTITGIVTEFFNFSELFYVKFEIGNNVSFDKYFWTNQGGFLYLCPVVPALGTNVTTQEGTDIYYPQSYSNLESAGSCTDFTYLGTNYKTSWIKLTRK